MNGASIACQLEGSPGGAGGGLSGRARAASEYSLVPAADSLPVLRSSLLILMPPQKLPKESHAFPLASNTRFGSIALKSSLALDSSTKPWSSQRYRELFGSSVLLVSRAIPEVFTPNAEYA